MTAKNTVVLLDRLGFDEHRCALGQALIDPELFNVHVLSMTGVPLTANEDEVASQQNVDLFDNLAVTTLLDEIETDCGIDYVVSLDEEHQMQCAQLRAQYGCFGRAPEQISIFRDKVKMKEKLDGIVKTPAFEPLKSYGDAMKFLSAHGKSVIKPMAGLGSERTYVIHNAIDLRLQLGDANINWSDYEIETFIEGTMVHIDAVIKEYKIVSLCVSQYLTSTLDYANGEPLMATHVPEENRLHELASQLLEKTVTAMEISSAVVHLEAFDTDAEQLTFCEIGLRPGGGGVRSQFHAATGIDLFQVYLNQELTQPTDTTNKAVHQLAGYLLFPPQNGAVKSVSDLEEFTDPWITTKRIFTETGDELSANSCCLGKTALFTVTADDIDTVIDRLSQLRQRFRLEVSSGCCA